MSKHKTHKHYVSKLRWNKRSGREIIGGNQVIQGGKGKKQSENVNYSGGCGPQQFHNLQNPATHKSGEIRRKDERGRGKTKNIKK